MQRILCTFLLLLGALALAALPAHAQLPPDARWSSFDTPRFRVHFHEPALEPIARRAAYHAETAYAQLERGFIEPPRARIELVVADNIDAANGLAISFPTNRLVVYTHPPLDQPSLSFFDDWLQLVITHELTHLFHLDQSGGVWRPLRRLFGRTVTLFPQYNTPSWVIEGLAVHYESALTRAGRIRGTHHDMILRAAALQDAFFPIDRASGAPVAWPGGSTRYVYGSLFVSHLATRHGEERVAEFVRDFGGRLIPFRLNAAARRAFGVPFTEAWAEWRDSLRAGYEVLADSLRAAGLTEPEILTPEGRWALHPRFAPDGTSIAYASSTARDEPSTRLLLADGGRDVLAARSSLDRVSWQPDGAALVTAELEFRDPYRLYSDLVRVSRTGERERLTRGARLREPDLHPDGSRVVAVGHAPGTNVLAVLELGGGAVRPLVEPAADVHWGAPRWSPQGDRIAAVRWQGGGLFDIVVLDTAGVVVRELTRDRAINTDPTWSADGRYVLFSSDRTGIANLHAYDLETDTLWMVTSVLTGAFQPDVSPDGQWIAFSYYSAEGYHIARIPFEAGSWRPAPPLREAFAAGPIEAPAAADTLGGPLRRYSAWPSVAPAGWLPQLEAGTALGTGFGAALDGRDVVGRHSWTADALLYARETRLDARLGYRYRGFGNPVLELSAAQEWDVLGERLPAITEEGDTVRSNLFLREQRAAALAQYVFPRWRSQFWLGGGFDVRQLEREWDHPLFSEGIPLRPFPLDLGARLFGGYSSVRGYGYSISPEDGVQLQLSTEARRYARAFEDEEDTHGYARLVGVGTGFQGIEVAGFARHVLALRLAGGYETGSVGPGFSAGGISGTRLSLAPGLELPGTVRTFGVRGYAAGAQRGDRAVAASAEYRFPLLLVERGVSTLPFFFDRLWGDVYLDAGSAWCIRNCEQRFALAPRALEPIAAAGVETAFSVLIGYDRRLTLRSGVAFPLVGIPTAAETRERPRPSFYLVAGRAF